MSLDTKPCVEAEFSLDLMGLPVDISVKTSGYVEGDAGHGGFVTVEVAEPDSGALHLDVELLDFDRSRDPLRFSTQSGFGDRFEILRLTARGGFEYDLAIKALEGVAEILRAVQRARCGEGDVDVQAVAQATADRLNQDNPGDDETQEEGGFTTGSELSLTRSEIRHIETRCGRERAVHIGLDTRGKQVFYEVVDDGGGVGGWADDIRSYFHMPLSSNPRFSGPDNG